VAWLGRKDNSEPLLGPAARLAGAVSVIMTEINGLLQPGEREVYLEIGEIGRKHLGETAYEKIFAEGEAMPEMLRLNLPEVRTFGRSKTGPE
jgi:hypothetical protein